MRIAEDAKIYMLIGYARVIVTQKKSNVWTMTISVVLCKHDETAMSSENQTARYQFQEKVASNYTTGLWALTFFISRQTDTVTQTSKLPWVFGCVERRENGQQIFKNRYSLERISFMLYLSSHLSRKSNCL